MPILADLSPHARTGAPQVYEDDRELDFWALDGSDLIEWTDEEWIIRSGIQGLDVAPRSVITEQVPGLPGSRLREIRTGERTVILPFFVRSADQDYRSHLKQLARLRRFLDFRTGDYAGDEGTFDLVAMAYGGTRTLRCTYVDGMEGATGYSPSWSTFDVKLLAVDPFWRGEEWSSPTVGTGAGEAFLSNSDADAWPRAIAPSVALGSAMTVAVGGDVPSPPSIALHGPFSACTISSPQGLSVAIGAVAAGSDVLIETGRRKRVTLNGSPSWSLVGDSPQWQPMPPGDATISIIVTDATADTTARVYGTDLWETAW